MFFGGGLFILGCDDDGVSKGLDCGCGFRGARCMGGYYGGVGERGV